MKLYEYSLNEISKQIRDGEVSALEVTKSVFDRIDEVEGHVDSFVTIMRESALESAKSTDSLIAEKRKNNELSDVSPLAGIPMALKDNMCAYNVGMTASSKMLENFIAPYDATVVKHIKESNGVIVGKTNMDEFAMGSSTETSYFKVTRNPWDLERVPGGSSGGSAACVAAGESYWSLGSDTGGSIRQPASLCGVVGMKPTYGLISRYGIVAFASSLDQVGPITRDVSDCAIVLNGIAKYDVKDSTSLDCARPDYTKSLGQSIKGMKIGVPKEYFGSELDSDVKDKVMDSLNKLSGLGAELVEISLPYSDYTMEIYYALAAGEASSNLARYDGIRYGYCDESIKDVKERIINTRTHGFGPEVKRRLILGTYLMSSQMYDEYYNRAMKVRTLVCEDMKRALSLCDCFVSPTTTAPAFRFGEKIQDPISMYRSDAYTTIGNITGIPSLSMPCGFVNNLPVGIQFSSGLFCEEVIFKVAHALECELNLKMGLPVIDLKGGSSK